MNKLSNRYMPTNMQAANKISRKSHTGAAIEPQSAKAFFEITEEAAAAAAGTSMYFTGWILNFILE